MRRWVTTNVGKPADESLAPNGRTMSAAAMVAFAYNEIDQARAELNALSK